MPGKCVLNLFISFSGGCFGNGDTLVAVIPLRRIFGRRHFPFSRCWWRLFFSLGGPVPLLIVVAILAIPTTPAGRGLPFFRAAHCPRRGFAARTRTLKFQLRTPAEYLGPDGICLPDAWAAIRGLASHLPAV